MSSSRFTFLVAVHAFFIKDDKVLLLERANTGYMDGFFSVPAGHVDGGEPIGMAAAREIYEEVGIEFDTYLEPAHAMHRLKTDGEERIDYFFKIDEWDGEPVNKEANKCAGLTWFPVDNLPENTIPYISFALSEVLAGKSFSEFTEEE